LLILRHLSCVLRELPPEFTSLEALLMPPYDSFNRRIEQPPWRIYREFQLSPHCLRKVDVRSRIQVPLKDESETALLPKVVDPALRRHSHDKNRCRAETLRQADLEAELLLIHVAERVLNLDSVQPRIFLVQVI
jgi:hypothetical protein